MEAESSLWTLSVKCSGFQLHREWEKDIYTTQLYALHVLPSPSSSAVSAWFTFAAVVALLSPLGAEHQKQPIASSFLISSKETGFKFT